MRKVDGWQSHSEKPSNQFYSDSLSSRRRSCKNKFQPRPRRRPLSGTNNRCSEAPVAYNKNMTCLEEGGKRRAQKICQVTEQRTRAANTTLQNR